MAITTTGLRYGLNIEAVQHGAHALNGNRNQVIRLGFVLAPHNAYPRGVEARQHVLADARRDFHHNGLKVSFSVVWVPDVQPVLAAVFASDFGQKKVADVQTRSAALVPAPRLRAFWVDSDANRLLSTAERPVL
ncbi:MAG: hypothetical protein LDL37_11865 [Asticcacaulis sp.]|uniref:hypothetical protein n=1 Tax=Asticcacaulis sp. TaxID=1872648 RepID=UPI0025C5EB68|nr:hypothetical protein [Asticcacaulis sp.]MCA1936142.1 hypothetical protein [Asticcacaulis sp.]